MPKHDLDTRDKILDAAIQTMTDKPTASMQDIATAADVSKAALYYFFENKEDLLTQLVEREANAMLYTWEQIASSDKDPRDKLEAIVTAWLEHIGKKHAVGRFILQQILGHNKKLVTTIMKKRHAKAAILGNILAEGREQGLWQLPSLRKTSSLMLNTLDFCAIERSLVGDCCVQTEKMHLTQTQIIHTFLAFLRP